MIVVIVSYQILDAGKFQWRNNRPVNFMNTIKKLLAKLGLIKLVWLEDWDGELTLAIKRKHPLGGDAAYRMWSVNRIVRLNSDGTCSGPIYVKKWVDYSA